MERVGFAGIGTMGAAMAANLARAGFPLSVWNRTAGRAARSSRSAQARRPRRPSWPRTPMSWSSASPTRPTSRPCSSGRGIAVGVRPGSLVIDCSTISPEASVGFAERLAAQGVGFVDAPVSGGSEGAQKGTLTIMCGGAEADVERAHPVLAAMGKTITHMGPVGAGQATKAVNQVILAGTYLGVAEGIVLAMKAGLDPETVVEALAGGAADPGSCTTAAAG